MDLTNLGAEGGDNWYNHNHFPEFYSSIQKKETTEKKCVIYTENKIHKGVTVWNVLSQPGLCVASCC